MLTIKHIKRLVNIFWYYTSSRWLADDIDQSKQISIHFKRESLQNYGFVFVYHLMQGITQTKRALAFRLIIAWIFEIFTQGVLDFWIRDVLAKCMRKFPLKKVGLLRNKNNKAGCFVSSPVDPCWNQRVNADCLRKTNFKSV